ncbi:MAG TPA: metalloregulator ArsR/SmtB family transcription factor [Candidatus Limnocylindria bacterium]|nr:metalloregulator ArsR/SmtB family transcription factor [Candidatus Limnocylindria bacterium]
MVDHGAALHALSDGTRRAIVDRLREAPDSVEAIARGLPVSRPAVSQHLAVLKGSGLVSERREGRRRVYRLEPAGLAALRAYVEGLWDDVLSAYAAAAQKEVEAGHDY